MLSKNALNNMKNRYVAVLKKCRLMNVFGTLALAGALGLTASLAMPSDAMAADRPNGVITTIESSTPSWTSVGDMTKADFTVTNSGDYFAGIYAEDGTEPLTITLASGDTLTIKGTSTDKHYYITGIASYRDDVTITNDGTINVTAYGTGNITPLYAKGLYADTDAGASFINNGTINVLTQMEQASHSGEIKGYAYGMEINGQGNNTLLNNGTMNVSLDFESTASSNPLAYAYGMRVSTGSDSATNSLTNCGTLSVSAEGKSASSAEQVWAFGLNANTLGSSLITNEESGIINMTATSLNGTAQAHGMYVAVVDANGTSILTNKGTINVTANVTKASADSFVLASGMTVGGSSSLINTLNNLGTINVSINADNMSAMKSANAYQAYVWDGTATIGTWNMVLGETYGTNGTGYYVFGVNDGATLNFDDNSTFVVVDLDKDIKYGKDYAISDMIDIKDGGIVTGSVGDVSTILDMVTVELINPNAEYDKQFIRATLETTADNSPPQGAATASISGASGHMSKLGTILAGVMTGGKSSGSKDDTESYEGKSDTASMYADAGETVTDATSYVSQDSPLWDAFILPFYGYTSENGGDYSTDMFGLAMGATRAVNDKFDLGFHFSIAKTESDADYTDSDATSYALGLHGMYNVDDAWYVRGQVSGFYSESDLNMVGSTSSNLTTATADMDTYGVYVELATGYDIELAPAHTITPELSLSYMYAHMEGFDSEYYMSGVASGVTFGMDSEDYDALYADASVRWTGAFDFQNGTLKPTAKVGIRQALTDPEVSSTLEIFGTKSTTYSDLNETAFTCEAGLAWEIGDVTTSLTYVGEFGDVEYSHMGMFRVAWEF